MRDRLINFIDDSGKDYDNMVESLIDSGVPMFESFCEWLADDLIAAGAVLPPVKAGQTVYFLLEDDIPVHKWYLSEEKVTEVCSKGFFTSAFYPAEDDFGNYTTYDEIVKTVFLTKEQAEQALKERERSNG